MPTETTASVLIGPIVQMMDGGSGSVQAETILTLNEGSRAAWVITEIHGGPSRRTASPHRPEQLLLHGLLGYLATRPAGPAGGRTRLPEPEDVPTTVDMTSAAQVATGLAGRRLLVTLIPGSTVRPEEIEELRALGVSISLFRSA